jgi:hypothetical protein
MSEVRLHNAILTSIRRIWWLVAVLLVLMSGFRLLFTIQFAHPEVWGDFLGSLPLAFAFGVLHDLRILLLFALPPTLSLLWMRNRTLRRWHRWLLVASMYWTLGIAIIIVALATDQIYYSYFGSHFNIVAFGAVEDDVGALLASAWENYPLLLYVTVGLVLLFLVFRIIRRAFHFRDFFHAAHAPSQEAVDRALNRHISLHVLVALVLCSTPLTPLFVDLQERYPQTVFVRAVPENGVEKLAETVWLRIAEAPRSMAKRFGYGDDPQDALLDFTGGEAAAEDGPLLQRLPARFFEPQPQLSEKPHVVLVVMESLATHLMQYQSAEFDLLGPLQRHIDRGALFKRFLPADNISAGSILGLAVNLPYRPGTEQLSQADDLKDRTFPSSTALAFAAQGYETAFYYGGPKDWRDLDEFLPLQGFDEYLGQEDFRAMYDLQEDVDGGPWGIWDEHLFRAVEDRLAAAEKPLFMVGFTTTNHPPHGLPADLESAPLQAPPDLIARTGQLDSTQKMQMATYQYACHELGKWLDRLEAASILGRTVVGITGDHTAGMGIPFSHQELLLQRAVPFLLLMPPDLAHQFDVNPALAGSHKDIPPTLLHAAGLAKGGYKGFGYSMLDNQVEHVGFNSSGLLLFDEGAVLMRPDGFDSMRWMGESLLLSPTSRFDEAGEVAQMYRSALSLADWLVYEGIAD